MNKDEGYTWQVRAVPHIPSKWLPDSLSFKVQAYTLLDAHATAENQLLDWDHSDDFVIADMVRQEEDVK